MTAAAPGPGSPLFLADLDHTLVRENTTFSFVAHVVRRRGGPIRRALHTLMLRRRSPGRLLGVALYRALGWDPLRGLALRLLRGFERKELEALAREYADGVLSERLLSEPAALLLRSGEEGARRLIVSASLGVVVAPLAEALGVEFRASELAWEGSRATGRLARDLAGAKLEAVEDLLEDAGHVTVMSDNLSDLPLLRRADRRLVVLRRPGDELHWTGLYAEFLGPWRRQEGGR